MRESFHKTSEQILIHLKIISNNQKGMNLGTFTKERAKEEFGIDTTRSGDSDTITKGQHKGKVVIWTEQSDVDTSDPYEDQVKYLPRKNFRYDIKLVKTESPWPIGETRIMSHNELGNMHILGENHRGIIYGRSTRPDLKGYFFRIIYGPNGPEVARER